MSAIEKDMKPTAFHRIRRFRVFGGFLDGTDIEFTDGLNCIIGPRGAGKTMKLGATDFIGKPFGRDNPLEDKIREALRDRAAEKTSETKSGPVKLREFTGGDLVFYDDRVELTGIRICGAKNSSIKRRVLDLLRERTATGAYRGFSMKDIADKLKLDREGAVAEAVKDLRKDYRERMRDEAGVDCGDEDVVSNQKRGYHLRDWIKVLDGRDEAEAAASEMQVKLTEHQKGIVRLLRKHGKRTPRQLSDGLNLRSQTLASEIEGLAAAGIIVSEGNGANKVVRLATVSVP